MAEKKLIIHRPRYGGETSVISMRMPKNMLAALDKVAAETGKTRNEILMLCIEFALDNIQIEKNDR